MIPQELDSALTPLSDPLLAERIPGSRPAHQSLLHTEVEYVPVIGDPDIEYDVELGLSKWRGHLVLDDLDDGTVPTHIAIGLDGADTADVETNRRIELQRSSTGSGLRTAKHDTDLLADLIDEDHGGLGTMDDASQLSQRLTHQSCLQANMRIPHRSFQFSTRNQRCHRIDNDDIHGARGHQHLADLECLLTTVGL